MNEKVCEKGIVIYQFLLHFLYWFGVTFFFFPFKNSKKQEINI